MFTTASTTQEKKTESVANRVSEHRSNNKSAAHIINNSKGVAQMKAHQEMVNNSPQMKQAAQLQAMANSFTSQQTPVFQLAGGDHAYDAGDGALWHVHHGDHVKFGGQVNTRINFGGRTRNQVLRQLRGRRNLTPQTPDGARTYMECVRWILRNV